MDSEDFAALDFLVGAIAEEEGDVGVGGLDARDLAGARAVGIHGRQLGSCRNKVRTPLAEP